MERADSTKSKLIINGSVSFNSNGMAPIPAFSLGKPALIAAVSLTKRRFSFDPQVAYGLNFRPWIIDNWVHYRLIYRPKFELRTGMDVGIFFSQYDAGDYKILQGQQYLTFEVAGIFKFSPKNSLSLLYWDDNGQDPGSLKGSFFTLIYDYADIKIGNAILFSGNVQLFYIHYTGKNDGLFISPKISFSVKDVPLALFFQATQPFKSNILPDPGFRWNLGMGYMF